MNDKRLELKELKGDILRCVIPFKDEDKQIEVYNIVGDRRKQILERLNELANEDEGLSEYIVDSYYTDLIMEFTDLKIDDTNITEILTSPRLEWSILRHELDDMIYEIQYEDLCEKISQARLLVLNGMKDQIDFEFGNYAKSVERQAERLKSMKEDD